MKYGHSKSDLLHRRIYRAGVAERARNAAPHLEPINVGSTLAELHVWLGAMGAPQPDSIDRAWGAIAYRLLP